MTRARAARRSSGTTFSSGPSRGRRRPARARIAVVAALVVGVFAVLLARLGQVQVLQPATAVTSVAASLDTRSYQVAAVRGRILDAQGHPLAANTTSLSLTLDRKVLADATDHGRSLVTKVAAAMQLSPKALWDKTFSCGAPGAPRPPACADGSPYQPLVVATHVDLHRALTVLEQPDTYPGVGVVTVAARTDPHPAGLNAAHLLGYLGQAGAQEVATGGGAVSDGQSVGKAGLEQQYDAVLRGTPGSTTVAVDPRGVVTSTVSSAQPQAGRDVVTHLSEPVQAAAEGALGQAVATARQGGYAADSAAAVVLDVTDGAVVAAASLPTYDPQVWNGRTPYGTGISAKDLATLTNPAANNPLVSRVSGAVMPPASTFKVVSVDAAAAMGVDLGGTYDCTSNVQIGDRVFNNYESRDFGPLSLQRNLEVSCDTIWYRFAYQSWLAQGGLSAATDAGDPFVQAARSFGLGSPTGVDLPDEAAGRIPDRDWKHDQWAAARATMCSRAQQGYPEVAATDPARAAYLQALAVENCSSGWQYRAGDAANFAIGQGDVAVTPLQLARVYAAVANGGTLWQPQVAAATQNADGSGRTPIAPVESGKVPISPQVKGFLDTALQGVVTTGTAAPAFVGWDQASYPLAGKTGSGEVFGKQATSWFASYGPVGAGQRPRYAVVVMVSQAGTGVGSAAPAARAIWDVLRGS